LYLWYKFKSIRRKLIVKHVKPKEETPKSTEIVNDLPHQIIIEENVMLYPRLSAWGQAKFNGLVSKIFIAQQTPMYMSTHPHIHAHITQSPSRHLLSWGLGLVGTAPISYSTYLWVLLHMHSEMHASYPTPETVPLMELINKF